MHRQASIKVKAAATIMVSEGNTFKNWSPSLRIVGDPHIIFAKSSRKVSVNCYFRSLYLGSVFTRWVATSTDASLTPGIFLIRLMRSFK